MSDFIQRDDEKFKKLIIDQLTTDENRKVEYDSIEEKYEELLAIEEISAIMEKQMKQFMEYHDKR